MHHISVNSLRIKDELENNSATTRLHGRRYHARQRCKDERIKSEIYEESSHGSGRTVESFSHDGEKIVEENNFL